MPWPQSTEGDFFIRAFSFVEGGTLPELKIHYHTLGELRKDSNGRAKNAVLILHGTTGNGSNFLQEIFAGRLFNSGQLLSADEYFLVLPDGIGHGQSSKPSDGLRGRFPRYCYTDMVHAQHQLLTQHFGIDHLRLVMGTSMGGMHSWMWATAYLDFMDAAFPLASLPAQIAGRNRMMRKMAIDSIRDDPEYHDGDYKQQPRGLKPALHVLAWMSSAPLKWQKEAPDRESADRFIDQMMEKQLREKDANDFLYAFDASRDYDPRPGLAGVKAALTAVNFADDQVNPPELRILEEETKKVPDGQAIVVPISDETAGHGTHTIAAVWQQYLEALLKRSS